MLSLDHNRISRVDAEDFAGLVESQQLSALSLGHNSISTIDGRAFKYVPNVSTLWLSNNDLTSLDGSANAGAIDEEGLLACCHELNATDTAVAASAMYLSPLLKLQRLFISHNRLQKLPNSFNKLTQLELIALNNNHLNEVVLFIFIVHMQFAGRTRSIQRTAAEDAVPQQQQSLLLA